MDLGGRLAAECRTMDEIQKYTNTAPLPWMKVEYSIHEQSSDKDRLVGGTRRES